MPYHIRRPLLLVMTVITIGIIRVLLLQTTPVGNQIRRSTTHVHQVGVFLTEMAMVYGQRQDLMILHMMVQMRAYLSVYHFLPQHGILLRALSTAEVAACGWSVTKAAIGLPLLLVTERTA